LSRRKRAAKFFDEDRGHIEAVIGMHGVLCLWLAAWDALILISIEAGNFEESAEVITLLLPYALSIPSVYIKMVSFLLIVIDHSRVIAIPILSAS
jgi:hypothetical protein